MKFAEMTQEVQVARPHDIYADIGLTPGRRRMQQINRDIAAGYSNCSSFLVNHLQWYWQPNMNNQETDRLQNREFYAKIGKVGSPADNFSTRPDAVLVIQPTESNHWSTVAKSVTWLL